MTSNQPIDPLFAPPANHWLRMVISQLRALLCAKTSSGIPETASALIAFEQRGWGALLNPLQYPIVLHILELTGPNITTQKVWVKLAHVDGSGKGGENTTELAFYPNASFTPGTELVQLSLSYIDDRIDFYFESGIYPGLTKFSGYFTGLNAYAGGGFFETHFEISFAPISGPSPVIPPTGLLPANDRATKTTVINTGDLRLNIFESGVLVAVIPPHSTQELPLAGRLALSAGVSASETSTTGKTATATVSRHTRELCGDILTPTPHADDPGNLV
jgi:hypothetical protein